MLAGGSHHAAHAGVPSLLPRGGRGEGGQTTSYLTDRRERGVECCVRPACERDGGFLDCLEVSLATAGGGGERTHANEPPKVLAHRPLSKIACKVSLAAAGGGDEQTQEAWPVPEGMNGDQLLEKQVMQKVDRFELVQ